MFLTVESPIYGCKKLHIEEILKITTKSRRTVQHWIQHPERVDSDSRKLLEHYAFGLLPSLSGAWTRLYIAGDEIRCADQPRFYVAAQELVNLQVTYQLNRVLKHELAALREAHTSIKEVKKKSAVIFDFNARKKKEVISS